MKIVIDIDEEDYAVILANADIVNKRKKHTLEEAVLNGIPLPKGHGRLGDLDAVEQEMINGIKAGIYEEEHEHYQHINDMDDCIECVRYADTIIEADKEN